MLHKILTLTALSGFITVALGAFGAHALKDTLDTYGHSLWNKAVLYQMFHTAALLALTTMGRQSKIRWQFSAAAFLIGILLFSGSLYLLALTGNRMLGMVTPFGGLAFLSGWAALFWTGLRGMRKE